MKELSIEEKAQRYNEAIEKFDVILNLNTVKESGTIFVDDVRKILHELADSDGERIRKEIIDFIYDKTDTYELREKSNSWLAWLEKQGEQTYDKVKPKFKVGDVVHSSNASLLIVGITDYCYNCVTCATNDEYSFGFDIQDEFKLVEQNPVDKVETKFKVGDWVIFNNNNKDSVYRIEKAENCQYTLRHILGGSMPLSYSSENMLRLWTIKDAKDGDVLCCKSGWTCIFKALDNHTNTFSSYCFMDKDKWFCNTGSECHTLDERFIKAYNSEITPATKEQRDLLFQKIKESGYEWDVDKKELKKIEQKPAEWSEEDERKKNKLIWIFEEIKEGADYFYGSEVKEVIDWLKSLRPQSTWKPSALQMEALESATENCAYSEYQDCLRELIEQLKKLREE